MTVRDFDDFLTSLDPDARGDKSPDGLKWGDLDMEVNAVGTTWMASMYVLHRAVEKGINLVIVHEPTFWFHGTPENTELAQCEQHEIDMSSKADFLAQHRIAIIRAHNCWDPYPVYGIEARLARQLSLTDRTDDRAGWYAIYKVPETSLSDLARHCKERLGLPMVRVSGELGKRVRRLVLAYGASSGTQSYYHAHKAGVEAVISGEQSEWSCIRPAIDMGLGVIELGHSNTEAEGMAGLAELLRGKFPDVSIKHIPAGDSFSYV